MKAHEANDKDAPIDHILICGSGLAGNMTAAALARHLPANIGLTLVTGEDLSGPDTLYGSVTAPSAYDFNLSVGVTEPALVLESDTAFSLGTRYRRWGTADRSWVQSFQLPLPVMDGVLFHHYLAQQNIGELEPFLISALAARNGSFAHPPEAADHPLARAEYGYQFDPKSYALLFANATDWERVRRIDAKVSGVDCNANGIAAIHLSDGQSLKAGLYLDCTGPEAILLKHLDVGFIGDRALRAIMSRSSAGRPGSPMRELTAKDFGWQAETPLKNGVAWLTVFDPSSEPDALAAHGLAPQHTVDVILGRQEQAWRANCVALGQAAAVFEPLTPAPVMLLQRDVERLLSLIPVSHDMSVECREFNRQFGEDERHAGLFHRALFETPNLPEGAYWRAARGVPVDDRLARKLEQFESRGLLVAFDLEPFTPEDWITLHYGMGRRPVRYDRMADHANGVKVRQHLIGLRRSVERTVKGMPSLDAYTVGLTHYLTQKGA